MRRPGYSSPFNVASGLVNRDKRARRFLFGAIYDWIQDEGSRILYGNECLLETKVTRSSIAHIRLHKPVLNCQRAGRAEGAMS